MAFTRGDYVVRASWWGGWRVNRGRLAEAVHRYAPGVPVIDGPDYPPSLSWTEGLRAKRARRSVNG
jgi:hypothetical protein